MGFREPASDGAREADGLPLMVLAPGTILRNSYAVEYFAAGGMSIVYLTERQGRRLLVKEVSGGDARRVMSLMQEKSILERLNHPGIVKVHDLFEEHGFYYLVMDYVEGGNLDREIPPQAGVFLRESAVLDWALQLCDIFEYLHSQKPPIIYRDLKPNNIIKDQDNRLHLVDFGIARIFKEHKNHDTEAMGTVFFASPEHFGAAQTDERSDIFTIGATLYYLLTSGKGAQQSLFEYPLVREINQKVSESMERVIAKAVQMEPRERFQSVGELRDALSSTSQKAAGAPGSAPVAVAASSVSGGPRPTQGRAASDKDTRGPGLTESEGYEGNRAAWGVILATLILVLCAWAFVILRGKGAPHGMSAVVSTPPSTIAEVSAPTFSDTTHGTPIDSEPRTSATVRAIHAGGPKGDESLASTTASSVPTAPPATRALTPGPEPTPHPVRTVFVPVTSTPSERHGETAQITPAPVQNPPPTAQVTFPTPDASARAGRGAASAETGTPPAPHPISGLSSSVFREPNGDFEMRIPPGYERIPGPHYAFRNPALQRVIAIIRLEEPRLATLEEVQLRSDEERERSFGRIWDLVRDYPVIGGVRGSASIFRFRNREGTELVHAEVLMMRRPGIFYVFIFETTPDLFIRYRGEFASTLASIRH
jgi:serine/threonine protein kinase